MPRQRPSRGSCRCHPFIFCRNSPFFSYHKSAKHPIFPNLIVLYLICNVLNPDIGYAANNIGAIEAGYVRKPLPSPRGITWILEYNSFHLYALTRSGSFPIIDRSNTSEDICPHRCTGAPGMHGKMYFSSIPGAFLFWGDTNETSECFFLDLPGMRPIRTDRKAHVF